MDALWKFIVDISPIPPEMLPLAVVIAAAAIGAMGILVIGFSTAKIKTFTAGDKGKSLIPKETMDNLIKAYNKILEGEAYIGTIEGYLTILRAIFGDNATINLTIVSPLHLKFDITAGVQQFYLWVDNQNNEIVDENGDNIVFEEIVALLSSRQLLELLKQTTNAGTFVEFTLNGE